MSNLICRSCNKGRVVLVVNIEENYPLEEADVGLDGGDVEAKYDPDYGNVASDLVCSLCDGPTGYTCYDGGTYRIVKDPEFKPERVQTNHDEG